MLCYTEPEFEEERDGMPVGRWEHCSTAEEVLCVQQETFSCGPRGDGQLGNLGFHHCQNKTQVYLHSSVVARDGDSYYGTRLRETECFWGGVDKNYSVSV